MLRFGLSAAVLVAAAAPAFAQSPLAGSPEIQQSAMALGQCVQTGIQGVAATVTPEAGAASVLSGCATQRQALERAVETMLAASTMPEAQKTAAREQVRSRLAQAETQIAAAIRQSRGAAPAN